ncbi:DMT family transporter [Mycetocola miduiensis]|uniref:Small multidrug resistance pump n=1 Tax=Mycetocola miduiensis TaxID=995034 RepID=A0A1I5AG04_9MICO|nr:multidrug efflux SMR transporter [Mycetocola miduiensis]SFN61320.1 small multidrug resistance pump [Mycetocola miduiensis]
MSEVTRDTPVLGPRLATSWLLLFGAIALEVVATSLLPTTQTFTLPVPSGVVLILYAMSYFLLSRCLGRIPLGVAYAVWSGAGTAAVAAIGIALLGEEATVLKGAGIGLIIVGVVAVNLPERARSAQISP